MESVALPITRAALLWKQRGAFPIPVEFKGKRPIGKAWEQQRLRAEDIPKVFDGRQLNLGVLWGECSGHLVDIDCDWPQAAVLAASLLPPTCIYDRIGALNSHRIYRVAGAKTRQWEVPAALTPASYGATVIELRSDGSQSVVPPSTHPSGEVYVWRCRIKPRELGLDWLLQRLDLIAAGSLLCQYWKQGIRHKIVMALSGAMLTCYYKVEDVAALITAIAEASNDENAKDRARSVQSSAEAIAASKPATGLPKLAELIGDPAVAVLKRWLNLGSAIPAGIVTSAAPATETAWSVAEPKLIASAPAEIVEVSMRWLWPNRIARGKLNMIAGEPGLSKSVLTCEIAAIVSRGGKWPLDGTACSSGWVAMLNVEDDPADTIKPRLMAAGADLDKIRLITGVQLAEGKQRGMTFADVEALDRYLEEHRRRFVLLVCDPIGALMAGADSHKDSEVRSLLAPLAALAVKHELAVLLVAHLNKAVGMTALNRVVGSIGFAAAVRMLYFLARDPQHRERLLLIPGKANLAPATMAGLSYELESVDLGKGIVAPCIRWHDVPEMRSANEVLNPPKAGKETPARLEAEDWLRARLATGPVPIRALREEAAMAVDGSWRSVQRAAGRLGVIGEGENKARTWRLPDEASRQSDITTTRHELSSCPDVDGAPAQKVVLQAGEAMRQPSDSWRDGAMSQCRDAIHTASGQTLFDLGNTHTQTLHPCTACARLELTGLCTHYGRTMPEPAKPNACIHWEQRPPDLPWEVT